jgi:hypothetical protein
MTTASVAEPVAQLIAGISAQTCTGQAVSTVRVRWLAGTWA